MVNFSDSLNARFLVVSFDFWFCPLLHNDDWVFVNAIAVISTMFMRQRLCYMCCKYTCYMDMVYTLYFILYNNNMHFIYVSCLKLFRNYLFIFRFSPAFFYSQKFQTTASWLQCIVTM